MDSVQKSEQVGVHVIVATNERHQTAGFLSWDVEINDLATCHVHHIEEVVGHHSEKQTHYHALKGSLLLYSATRDIQAKIYNIREGESLHTWRLSDNVTELKNFSSIQWRSKTMVALTVNTSVTFWDIGQPMVKPHSRYNSITKIIRAVVIDNADDGGERELRRNR